MKSDRLLDCIGNMKEEYIMESEADTKKRAYITYRKAIKFGVPVAVCVSLLLIGNLYRDHAGDNTAGPLEVSDHENEGDLQNQNASNEKGGDTAIRIQVNEMEYLHSADQYQAGTQQEMQWDKIVDYFGIDLNVADLPDGLEASVYNMEEKYFVVDDNGNIVDDRVTQSYYSGYYEDGSPKSMNQVPVPYGFDITYSKIGFVNECIYTDGEDVAASEINGEAVMIGHRMMEYGPYDETTHEAAGQYDLFTAQFTDDGIYYDVVSTCLPQDDFIKIISSLIKH